MNPQFMGAIPILSKHPPHTKKRHFCAGMAGGESKTHCEQSVHGPCRAKPAEHVQKGFRVLSAEHVRILDSTSGSWDPFSFLMAT